MFRFIRVRFTPTRSMVSTSMTSSERVSHRNRTLPLSSNNMAIWNMCKRHKIVEKTSAKHLNGFWNSKNQNGMSFLRSVLHEIHSLLTIAIYSKCSSEGSIAESCTHSIHNNMVCQGGIDSLTMPENPRGCS